MELRLPGSSHMPAPSPALIRLIVRVAQARRVAQNLFQADVVLGLPGHSMIPASSPALIKAHCQPSCRCSMWQRTCPRLGKGPLDTCHTCRPHSI